MKNYDWILFDIDETLLRFNSFAALEKLFSHFNSAFTEKKFAEYEAKNKLLWTEYQNGKITLTQLQHDRFFALGKQFNISPLELDNAFLAAITDVTIPLDGASDLLNSLKGKNKLGIITNGSAKTQHTRIKQSGFHDHFNFIVTSEEVGFPKPHRNIFEHAFSLMGNPAPQSVLMVGDSLEADILGGINAGIDTCWLNHHKKIAPDNITPHFEIASLAELKNYIE